MKKAKFLALAMVLLLALAAGLPACSAEDAADDGHNPAMNYAGYYVCDRASIFIGTEGSDGMIAEVTWGSSAWETSVWTMSGTFDPETKQMEYQDCVRTDYVYNEDGEESHTEAYTEGKGSITFTDGEPVTLTWQDEQEHMADDMVFEYTSDEADGESVGIANPWSTADSLEAAAEGAGLDGFTLEEGMEISLGKVFVSESRYMDGIAEAYVAFPAVDMTIRKGLAAAAVEEGDISGDYNEYANEWTQNIKGLEVKCFGNREGDATKTIWQLEDTCYSITAYGMGGDTDYGLSADDLNTLINSIQ